MEMHERARRQRRDEMVDGIIVRSGKTVISAACEESR